MMDTSKIYKDLEGNECTIHQMVKREPYWIANRFQELEIQNKKLVEFIKTIKHYESFYKTLEQAQILAHELLEYWEKIENLQKLSNN